MDGSSFCIRWGSHTSTVSTGQFLSMATVLVQLHQGPSSRGLTKDLDDSFSKLCLWPLSSLTDAKPVPLSASDPCPLLLPLPHVTPSYSSLADLGSSAVQQLRFVEFPFRTQFNWNVVVLPMNVQILNHCGVCVCAHTRMCNYVCMFLFVGACICGGQRSASGVIP